MPDLARLRREFDDILRQAWTTWVEHLGSDAEEGVSPFHNLDLVPDLDDDAGFNHSVGWLYGVHEATGWPLDRPAGRLKPLGPKDWTPGKR